jgi:hypothetical protein
MLILVRLRWQHTFVVDRCSWSGWAIIGRPNVGAGGLNLNQSSELIHIFSEIGIILLMFLAGL